MNLAEGVPPTLRDVWFWSKRTAPLKIPPELLTEFVPPEDQERLQIRVVAREDPPPRGRRVTAAPKSMWLEVPEELLPTYPVPGNGMLAIPLDPGESWRLRAVEPGRGTWWRDLRAGRRSVTLNPVAAVDLHLSVVDELGEGIAKARARVVGGGAGGRKGRDFYVLYFSADGTFSIPGVPEAEVLSLLLSAPGYPGTVVHGRPRTLPPKIRFYPGATVTGRFLDEDRRPVVGADVQIEAWIDKGLSLWLVRKAQSDATGKWRLPNLPPGSFVLMATAPEVVAYKTEMELGPEGLDLGEITLMRGRVVTLTVINPESAPVPGAEVRTGTGETLLADGNGEVELRGVPAAEPFEITIDARGYRNRKATLGPQSTAVVTLWPLFVVSGVLLDAEGHGVERGLASARAGNRTTETKIQPGGYFELELEPGKSHRLRLSSPATGELQVDLDSGRPGEERHLGELRAPASHVVTGRLISALDGLPVADARLWLPRPTREDPLRAWFTGDVLEARSDYEGAFILRGLGAVPARLRIEAPGHARKIVDLRPEPEIRDLDLGTIELTPGLTVSVLTHDPGEHGATARIDLGNQWLEMDMLTAPIHDGVATFYDVPPGEVTVTVLRDRSLLCEKRVRLPVAEDQVEVECTIEAMRVSGFVQVGGHPVGPGRLSWLPPPTDGPAIIERTQGPTGLLVCTVVGAGRPQVDVEVGGDGFFSTDQLRSGTWQVAWHSRNGASSQSTTMELPQVDEMELVLDFPARTIEGFVLHSDEQPVGGARVRELSSGALTFSAEDGTFRLLGVDPGTRYLKAQLEDEATPVVRVEVSPDEDPDPVYLVFGEDDSGGELTVMVVADEAAIPGAFVFVDPDSGGQRILTTNAHGRATASFAPPYPPRLRFAAFAAGTWVLGGWMSWEKALEDTVVLTLGPTGSVSVGTGGQPAPIRLVSPQGWDVAWLLTRLALRPAAEPGRPLVITGLPEGIYELTVADGTEIVVVSEGQEARAKR